MVNFLKTIKSKLVIKSDLLILISSIYFGIFLNLAFWKGILSKIEINNFGMVLFGYIITGFDMFYFLFGFHFACS